MSAFQISNLKSRIVLALLVGATAVRIAAAASTVVPIVGDPFTADIAAIDNIGQITFQAGTRQFTLRIADMVRWGACPEQGRAGGLLLADGGWLAADVLSADGKTLVIESDLFGLQKIPLAAMYRVVLQNSPSVLLAEGQQKNSPRPLAGEGQGVRAARHGDEPEVKAADSLLLTNGDQLTGQFLGLSDAVVKFQTDAGPIEVKTELITAIVFPAEPTPKNPAITWAGFTDGSRLLVSQISTEKDLLHLTVADQPLTVSRSELVFLQPITEHIVYLSDLTPIEHEQTPYLDLSWPYRNDRNVAGGPLRCNGERYLKGLGVHSASRLVYSLSPLPQAGEGQGVRAELLGMRAESPGVRPAASPLPLGEGQGVRAASPGVTFFGAPKKFAASLAVDDATDRRGSVQFRVLVDGRERYASPVIRGGQPPVPISIDLRGARRLELIVDYADRIDILDRANWLDARLMR